MPEETYTLLLELDEGDEIEVGTLGPMSNFLGFPRTSKLFMVFLMWIGRLEILPVLVLLTPAYWRT